MSAIIRKNVCLPSDQVESLKRLVRAKGGYRKGYTFSSELTTALRQYLQRQAAMEEETEALPLLQRLLDDKFGQLETWLRPGVYGGATYSTTAALILLEMVCGKTVSPEQARDYFELMRGRAWKIVRKEPAPQPRPASSE